MILSLSNFERGGNNERGKNGFVSMIGGVSLSEERRQQQRVFYVNATVVGG